MDTKMKKMNKKFRVTVTEINCDEDFNPIEQRTYTVNRMATGRQLEMMEGLSIVDPFNKYRWIEQMFDSLKFYYAANMDKLDSENPFTPIKGDKNAETI